MGALPLYGLPLLVALGAGPARTPPVEPGRPLPGGELAAEDARYLDWLIDDFLFDPRRAEYVRVSLGGPGPFVIRRGRLVQADENSRDGWLVRGTNGGPDRVYFADGESMAVPAARTRPLDFAALCTRRYGPTPPAPPAMREEIWARLVQIERALDANDETDLVNAAWLHRRGYDGLAARALDAARDTRDDPRESLRTALALRANAALVRAFADRADAEAVAHAARLFALYPDLVADRGPQAAAIVADITRRHHAGLGSREPPRGPPPDFPGWDLPRRLAFLIAALDEVEAGTFTLWELDRDDAVDWRVAGLVGLGDAAVPALIDAYEHDARLTRQRELERIRFSCGKSRVDRPERVIPARDVARLALDAILRVNDLDPTGPEDAEADGAPPEGERLRRYWARYGRLPFADRMMAVLTDPAARPAARREAAAALVASADNPESSWTRTANRRPRGAPRPTPFIARYSHPTVAEAVFAAMDRERAALAGARNADRWDRVEDEYLDVLTGLGDPRAGPELARRAARATSPAARARLARAAADLGVGGPLSALAREVTTGAIRLAPPAGEPGLPAEQTLRDLVYVLISIDRPETEAALYALADPGHPYFPLVDRALRAEVDPHARGSVWTMHPFCLAVLRHALADDRPTGGHSYRRGSDVEDRTAGRLRRWTPPGGADPDGWLEHVERRGGDDAADRLADLVVGLPEYHPLRRDADRVRAETRVLLGRYAGRFRRAENAEQRRWDVRRTMDVAYVPDLRPLGRPATAADVAAGRAVFTLNGTGKVADVRLPAWVVLKVDANTPDAPAGLVVQAEVGPDGAIVYGAIFRHAIRSVRASEVERLEPVER